MNLKQREVKTWGLLTLAIILVWGTVIGMLYDHHRNNQKILLATELQGFEGEVNSTLVTYEAFANYIFDEINQDKEVRAIISKANTASPEEKKLLRERLYNKLSNKYEIMQAYDFRQFHFHLPTTESFLRVHSPDKYGDFLLDSRESVRLVNETKTKISGFEEGKIFNGFRNVYPLQYNNRHIGSVEISMSSASIIKVLSELYPNEDLYFIIDKLAVDGTVFEDEMANYKDSAIFDGYYVDKEVYETITPYNTVIPQGGEKFSKSFSEKFSKHLSDKQSFAKFYKFDGKNYTVRFLSIMNIQDLPIAYMISISENLRYKPFIKDMYTEITLVSLLALFIIAFSLILTFYQYNLKNSAELDFLTQIYNRNKFYEIADREIKAARRYKHDLVIMLIDIDKFKQVNDSYGHDWGDGVLKELARLILGNVRDVDVFARWGGEEFVLLLPRTNKESGLLVAEKLRRLIEKSEDEYLKDITISIGVSMVDSKTYDIDEGIKRADEAMYYAKENGRNQVCFK